MNKTNPAPLSGLRGERIRVRGLVQGVGLRPTVWRLAHDLELAGDVCNDGAGVLIRLWASADRIDEFCRRLIRDCPPLARIESLERFPLEEVATPDGFRITPSVATAVHTGIVTDAATCQACLEEIRDPSNRRYRYPFTNCTHCGPRLSIVCAIPYDRSNTSMRAFPMCRACNEEYRDPADRRFHAQPNACPVCGPQLWLEDGHGRRLAPSPSGTGDVLATASALLAGGRILAIQGIGGFHLACDAGDENAVAELRRRKHRYHKPFALMAPNLEVINRYCRLRPQEARLLADPAAPILLLERDRDEGLAAGIAPGQTTLGFMLPYSPLHHLLLQDWSRPLVMTSGNLSEEPQCISVQDGRERLGELADFLLLHNREILNRVDDSVVRLMDGAPRLLRRARGYAPAPITLVPGFERAPPILALGAELKNNICLLAGRGAILSQHLGDLEEARTATEYERTITLYRRLFQHDPRILAVDLHPDYRSSQLGRTWAAREGLELEELQHHFAHIASVLADNGRPPDTGRVLGIALDGLGYGADGTVWGGEFLLADYRGFERAGHLKPVPLLGATQAVREPWRNTYAQLDAHLGWQAVRDQYPDLELIRYLDTKPLRVLATMMARGINSPLSSSCGRLFDAVAAALGLNRELVSYEGQAAIELESLATPAMAQCPQGYPFAIATADSRRILDPTPMWHALLADLARGRDPALLAARFHSGLVTALVRMALILTQEHHTDTVILSGGVFQNRLLLDGVAQRLRTDGLLVLSPQQVPANDGGISLGQAVIAAARRSSA